MEGVVVIHLVVIFGCYLDCIYCEARALSDDIWCTGVYGLLIIRTDCR